MGIIIPILDLKTLMFREVNRVGQDHKGHKHQNNIEPSCMNWLLSESSA